MSVGWDYEEKWADREDAEEFFVEEEGGRMSFPLDGMAEGDFFILDSEDKAKRARSAIQYYYRDNPVSRFYVLRRSLREWVCRRVV